MSETTTPPFRTVPQPTAEVNALLATALALKENVDSLTRQRGDPQVWAATVREVATGANGDGAFPTNAAYLRGLVDQAVTLVGALSQTIGGKLNTGGGAMTGPLTLAGNPTAPMQAATKAYVDLNGATAWADIPNRPVAFPPKPHNHPINDIILLQVELDNRSLVGHKHTWAELIPPEGADLGLGYVLTWDGAKITLKAPTGGSGGGLYIGTAPPTDAARMPFWFDTNAGSLLIGYNDGNSFQWVPTMVPVPGAPGAPGAPGPAGSSTLSGARAPTVDDGRAGDFWIDTAAWAIYGPKAASGWPAGVPMRRGGMALTLAGERALLSGTALEMS
jgi:hypothetical protein